jgi:hypothetical protein
MHISHSEIDYLHIFNIQNIMKNTASVGCLSGRRRQLADWGGDEIYWYQFSYYEIN